MLAKRRLCSSGKLIISYISCCNTSNFGDGLCSLCVDLSDFSCGDPEEIKLVERLSPVLQVPSGGIMDAGYVRSWVCSQPMMLCQHKNSYAGAVSPHILVVFIGCYIPPPPPHCRGHCNPVMFFVDVLYFFVCRLVKYRWLTSFPLVMCLVTVWEAIALEEKEFFIPVWAVDTFRRFTS